MEENKILQELLDNVRSLSETVNFIKDNAVTKDEFNELKGEFSEMKGDISEMKQHISNIESELHSINIELKDIKFRLDKLEKRTKEDSDAHASDILELRQRVQMLERQVKQLQPAH